MRATEPLDIIQSPDRQAEEEPPMRRRDSVAVALVLAVLACVIVLIFGGFVRLY